MLADHGLETTVRWRVVDSYNNNNIYDVIDRKYEISWHEHANVY